MPILTAIDGQAFPTAGAATAGSVGVDTLTGNWSHVESTDVPPGGAAAGGSIANGYLQMPAGEGGSLRIDAPSSVFAGAEEDHWVRLWAYAGREGALAADGTNWRLHQIVSGSTKLTLTLYLRDDPANPGFTAIAATFMGGSKNHLSRLGGSAGPAVVPLDGWFRVEVHVRRHATGGVYAYYLNGVLVGEVAALDTQTGIALGDLQADWTIALGAVAGVRWRVSAPIESWTGTDIAIRPLEHLTAPNGHLHRHWVHHWVDATGYDQGRTMAYAGTEPNLTVDYATGGLNPHRRYWTPDIGPHASPLSHTVETIDAAGPLPYNAEGWASVLLTDFLVSTDAAGEQSLTLSLRNADDTADLVTLVMDQTTGMLTETTGGLSNDLAAWSVSTRYALVVSLNKDGRAAWALVDLTNDFDTTQTVFAGDLSGWEPASVGKVRLSLVMDNSAPQVGAVHVSSWWEAVLVDSMAHADANLVSPELAMVNHVADRFAANRDYESVPGGPYPMRDQWAAANPGGVGRRAVSVVMARSGLTLSAFNAKNLDAVGRLRGAVLWMIDGAAINDLATTYADDDARDAAVAAHLADAGDLADAALAGGNRLAVATTALRTQGTYDDRAIQAQQMVNAGLVAIGHAKQQRGAIEVMDWASGVYPHAALFSPGDDVHPNAAGDASIALAMMDRRTVPADVVDPPATTGEAGVINRSLDLLRLSLADTPAFRDWVGATTREQALARVYVDGLPEPAADGGEYTADELRGYRPYALVYLDDGGYTLTAAAVDGAHRFTDAGRMVVEFEDDVPEALAGNPAGATRAFTDRVGAVADGLAALAGVGGYLAATDIEMTDAPRVAAPNDREGQGHYVVAKLAVGWGVQG